MRVRGADAWTLALVVENTNAHALIVRSVRFSPDGTKIVSGSADGSIRLWGGQPSLKLFMSVRCTGGVRG